jgi:hypothetical protein
MALTMADIKKQAADKMAKSIDTLKHNLAKVRTGRAHVGLLDHLRVDYYGTATPIGQVANVTLVDARTIGVQPYEKKMVQAVERAIRDSDLCVNPATSGASSGSAPHRARARQAGEARGGRTVRTSVRRHPASSAQRRRGQRGWEKRLGGSEDDRQRGPDIDKWWPRRG